MWRPACFTLLFSSLLSSVLLAQGTKPRANASAYEVQASLADISIGAEYLVHSIPASSGYRIANDYLVIEAALFGPRLTTVKLATSDFQLRINGVPAFGVPAFGVPALIDAQGPSFVAQSIRATDGGFFGNPQRAPGDPNRQPLPRPPTRVPSSVSSGVDPGAPPPPLEQQIDQVALPMGEQKVPVSGIIFFPFKGKTTTIKSLELIYAGKLTLKFF